ncbi:hypothetical protein BHE74_00043703, partial [Ensete ventricosum]
YVDVILQLIDKAGDFVSDDIWYRVVQFVTNNEDLQKREKNLESCSPARFVARGRFLLTARGEEKSLHVERRNEATYESYIDVEIQQRAVEYIALCKKGAALVDVLAEMPKFPERQVESALLKKAEVAEVDTAEQSAIIIRSQQQTSNALVVTDQRPTEGSLPVSQLGLVRMPSEKMEASTQDQSSFHQGMIKENGVVTEVVPQAVPPADLLGDLLGPLAINGSPAIAVPVEQRNQNLLSVLEATPEAASPLALTTIDNQPDSIQVPY